MALTNNIITMYMVHTVKKNKNKKHYYITITYVLDNCTKHQISERTTAAKMLRKKYPKADTQLDLKKNQHLNS